MDNKNIIIKVRGVITHDGKLLIVKHIGTGFMALPGGHLKFREDVITCLKRELVEELGFVGGALLIAGYAYLLWRVIRPLVRGSLTDAYPYIFTIGLFSMILTQIFINTGMNMGIIPITGITLPFVSYGGSSVLSLCLSFGLLWAIRGR